MPYEYLSIEICHNKHIACNQYRDAGFWWFRPAFRKAFISSLVLAVDDRNDLCEIDALYYIRWIIYKE